MNNPSGGHIPFHQELSKEGQLYLMRYNATFYGRTKGAIGVFYNVSTTIEAENEHKAHNKLYDFYEHIMDLKLKEVKDDD